MIDESSPPERSSANFVSETRRAPIHLNISRRTRSSASAPTQIDWSGSVNRHGFQMGRIDIELPCQCPTSPHLISRTPWTQVAVVQLSSQSLLSAMLAKRIERRRDRKSTPLNRSH